MSAAKSIRSAPQVTPSTGSAPKSGGLTAIPSPVHRTSRPSASARASMKSQSVQSCWTSSPCTNEVLATSAASPARPISAAITALSLWLT